VTLKQFISTLIILIENNIKNNLRKRDILEEMKRISRDFY
jgi:hypothetical protein